MDRYVTDPDDTQTAVGEVAARSRGRGASALPESFDAEDPASGTIRRWRGPGDRSRLSALWARVFFWICAMSVPASSVIAIAVLSHVLGARELATISAIFAVGFVGTVLPLGIQARSAADAAAHGTAASVRWRPFMMAAPVWVAVSPILAVALHVPLLAMLSPALGLVPSMAVGVGRGEMIGQQRFVGAGVNHLVETSIRLVAGIGLGVWLGVDGVALTLVACQVGSWALLPRRHGVAPGFIRLPGAFGATALLLLSIQIDLLIAPRLLGPNASAYATSALPAKAVYLALGATAWFVVPGAVRCRRLAQAVLPLSEVVFAGTLLSVVLAFASPWIGAVLGSTAPDPPLVLGLGLGMALAAGNWILMQIRLARAPSGLWMAPAVAVVVTGAIASLDRTDLGFCAGMLIGQSCALAVSLLALHVGLRRTAELELHRHADVVNVGDDVGDEPEAHAGAGAAPTPTPDVLEAPSKPVAVGGSQAGAQTTGTPAVPARVRGKTGPRVWTPEGPLAAYGCGMAVDVLILGAGFGGLELSSRLSEEVSDDVRVTLIDQNDSFVFGFSKLDVMFGIREPGGVRCHYADISKRAVDFRRETIVSIDPHERHVTTDAGEYDADILVIALGADLDTAATPGLDEVGYEFYSPAGAERVRDVLPSLRSGTAVIGVLGPFFKCPPAPNEAAFLLHDYLTRSGVRDAVTIHLLSPLPSPIPISPDTSAAIASLLAERDIRYAPRTLVTRLDPASNVAHFADGGSLPFDLFLGVPVHRAPAVVVDAGMTDDGWVAVDPATFATRFSDVYAVGDITSAPVPRAGVFAEGEARTVADVIITRLGGGSPPRPYQGLATCYIEMGDHTVGKVDLDFYQSGGPSALFTAPSVDLAQEKQQFGATRRSRWFGYAD